MAAVLAAIQLALRGKPAIDEFVVNWTEDVLDEFRHAIRCFGGCASLTDVLNGAAESQRR
jgi:hypothetical protein